jgi:predicted ATPase/DNA-binding CsgD family transcriptional regulator
MTRHIPTVRDGTLREGRQELASPDSIAVESTSWYTWLEEHHSFRFEHAAGSFTARKEQRSGSWYWYAYRCRTGRLHTAYLGRSEELSATRLQVIADELAGAEGSRTPRTAESERLPGLPDSYSPNQANVTPPRSLLLHNLRQLTSLVGREQEVATATALLQRSEVRLLTLVGTAGVGKTRLALQVAFDLLESFPDGVFFVALAPLRDPDLVLPTVAQALGLRVTGDQPILEALKANLRDRSCLLVLDNFEQVVSAASQLPELLRACPDVKLLVTSREVLHLRAEHQFSVPPLALPDRKRLPDAQTLAHVASVELFLQRAQAISPDFHLTPDNAAAIADICIRLDGLPLTIELAAARIKVFTPQALLARLDHRLQVLTGGARDLPERQRTLRATIAWSYELLPMVEQRLFRRFAVFVGGCTLVAVEAVSSAIGDTGLEVLEGIVSLVNKSLLHQNARKAEEPRFTMLETIREYGLEALATCGEEQATYQAHAAYYLRLSERAEPELTGPQQLTWFERLEREHDNLRAALSWLLEQGANEQSNELALCLSGALAPFWEIHGYVSEGWRWLDRTLRESRGSRAAVRAKALIGAAALATMKEDFAQAEALCAEGLALYRDLGDGGGSATALSRWGYAAVMQSNYTQARALLEEALALFRQVGDTGGCASTLHRLATVLFYQGEYTQAQALLEECRVLTSERGDVQDNALALALLGMVLLYQGDLTQAQTRLEESLVVSRKVGYKRTLGHASNVLGLVTFLRGDVAKARSLWEESLILFQEVGERGRMAEVLLSKGFIPFSQADYEAARALVEESLQIFLELNNKWDITVGLEGLATVVAAQGEPVRAAWLMSAAQTLREAIGVPLPSVSQALHEFTMASVRTQLGEQAFAAAWAEGCTMTPEQAWAAQWPTAMSAPALTELLPMPQTPKAPSHSNGLTARELEVLRLLAQGLTSAQIANRLIIGLVTVNSHVRSIYSKLGVTSRSAATRYAIEHRLV